MEFDNRLAEHLAADRLYYRSTFWWRVDKVVAVALVAMGLYLIAAAGLRWWTAIWLPLGVLEWFNLMSLRPLQIRHFFKQNPKFSETYRLGFSDTGIDFKTKSLDSRVAWTHYSRVLENHSLVLLIYGSRMYTVIPKRAFLDSEQQARFMTLVREHVGKGAAVGA